jgi:hypothetical protein
VQPASPAGSVGVPCLLIAGSLYFPMALLAVIIYDNLAALNPVLVVLSILKAPIRYGILVLLIGLLAVVDWRIGAALNRIGVPFLSGVVNGFTTLYVTMVAMRALGWFYYCTRDQLGWS